VAAPLLRILSDLHLGDERSWLHDPAALVPLLDGVDALVLNGDLCDTQHDYGPAEIAALKRFFLDRVPRVTFLTGNHDPDISTLDELTLADSRVWVTHGDVLFDDIAPWSRQQPELARRIAALRPSHAEADWKNIAPRLRMMREASRHLPREQPAPAAGSRAIRLRRAARDLFPPQRAFAMLRAWATAPGRALQLAAEQRPAARFVVTGHIHFPTIRRNRTGRVFINTGSFSPPLGTRCVDLVDETMRVRRVERRGEGFHPGRVIAEFALA